MADSGGVRSPYWQVPKEQIVMEMDELFILQRYKDHQQFAVNLYETAAKNPEEWQFYIETIELRLLLIKDIQQDVARMKQEAASAIHQIPQTPTIE